MKAVSTARGRGKSFKHRRRDDAERAFRADEEMLEIVAGIVLAAAWRDRTSTRPSASTTSSPSDEIAGVAIGQHGGAAGIGGEIAADGAGAFRRQRQRKQAVRRARRPPAPWQRTPASTIMVFEDGSISRSLFKPSERQQDFVARSYGRLAADEAGIAALRHDLRAPFSLQSATMAATSAVEPGSTQARLAMIEVARLAEIAGHRGRVGDAHVRRRRWPRNATADYRVAGRETGLRLIVLLKQTSAVIARSESDEAIQPTKSGLLRLRLAMTVFAWVLNPGDGGCGAFPGGEKR